MVSVFVALAIAANLRQAPVYISVVPYKNLGWHSNSQYFLFESDLGGNESSTITYRSALDAQYGALAKRWERDTDSNKPTLEVQSRPWLRSHPSSGTGATVFQFKGPYFTAEKGVPEGSNIPRQTTFKVGRSTYSLKLDRSVGKLEQVPDMDIKYRLAKFTLSIRRDNGSWHILRRDTDYRRMALDYAIDRVILSPNRRSLAVIIEEYRGVFFEGWNVSAAGVPVVGRLP